MIRKLQDFLRRMEPFSVLASYVSICACAYFGWFHPFDIQAYLGENDGRIQTILFTIGGALCVLGHVSKIMIIELLGLISSIFGCNIFLFIVTYFTFHEEAWRVGIVITTTAVAMFLLTGRALKLQHEINAIWLRPYVNHSQR